MDHRVTRIGVGHPHEPSGFHHDPFEGDCVFERRCQRLLANDVEAAFQKGFRDREMGVIGSADRNGLDAISPPPFAGNHGLVVAIGALWVDSLGSGERLASRWIDIKRTGDELKGSVKARGDAVDIANIGAFASTDHAEAKRPPDDFVTCELPCRCRESRR